MVARLSRSVLDSQDSHGLVSDHNSKSDQLSRNDEQDLSRAGKKQTLKRRFGIISTLGLSTTLMLTWEGVLVYFGFGLANGGSAGLFTSYILNWVGFLAIMVPLAELASMAPTASGQYHWVYMLAPKRYGIILSYVTGWLSVAVWQSIVAMGGILCSTLIQGLLVLNYPDSYTPKGWHGTLMIWATIVLSFVVNSALGRWLPKIEGFILYLHVIGFFALMIPLVYLGRKVSAETVFTSWNNDGGWPTTGLAFFVGIITNVGPFLGADGAVHMAEETHNAASVIPWNIVITIVFNGLLGLGILLVTLFRAGDITTALETSFHYPFIQIIFDSTQSTAGTTVLVSVILVLAYSATFGQFAGASRQLWAFARDHGPPMSKRLLLVDPKTFLPMNAIMTTGLISILLSLINIGSETALNSVLSFTVSSWEAAASIPLGLLLWSRTTGRICQRRNRTSLAADTLDSALTWGPWRVTEPLGTLINITGLIWITITFFFSFWPGQAEVTASTMNFSIALTGFWIIFGLGYYSLIGKKHYNGPVNETNGPRDYHIYRRAS
ncbi:amino acid/polyamine transporter I [Xylaria arbuscula]|nr:amino acid/polyamine transporter I [Xylaria arbuscula]